MKRLVQISPLFLAFILGNWMLLLGWTETKIVETTFLRGFYSYSSLAFIFLTIQAHLRGGLAHIFSLISILFCTLLTELILANGSQPDFRFFAKEALLLGNLLTLRLFIVLGLSIGTFILMKRYLKEVQYEIRSIVLVCISVLLFALDLILPKNGQNLNWAQINPITEFAQKISWELKQKKPQVVSYKIPDDKYVASEGTHIPGFQPMKEKRNIILLVLEGFSERYLDFGLAPTLKKELEQSYHAPRFLTNHVQTNRGLYTILCNDYCNLSSSESKSDVILTFGSKRECLPAKLVKQGYSSAYLQSEALDYSRKDLFASAIGFQQVRGSESFAKKDLITSWGISDGKLMESTANAIKAGKFPSPYFITILTSSTQHPFKTPTSSGNLANAIRYTDHELKKFLRQLRKQNFFDNGILIITSDEARTIRPERAYVVRHMGVFGIIGKDIPKFKQNQMRTQLDVTPSIVDYLGLEATSDLKGRSGLKNYQGSRPIFIGHSFKSRPIFIEDNKTAHVCDPKLNCKRAQFSRSFFDYSDYPKLLESNKSKAIREYVLKNDVTFKQIGGNVLFQEKNFTVKGSKLVLGDFQSPATTENLTYRIEADIKPGSAALYLDYQYFPCWETDAIQYSEKVVAKNGVGAVTLEMPAHLANKPLCHFVKLRSEKNSAILIKSFELLKAPVTK